MSRGRPAPAAAPRNPTIDGVRGLAALVVFVCHCFQYHNVYVPCQPATYAVWVFFVLSGYVLVGSYRSHFVAFLAKRFVRLWPLYALCMAAGVVLTGIVPHWTRWLWWPMMNANAADAIDPPAWSLHVEWWAMLAFPAIALARRGAAMAVVLAALCLPLMVFVSPWFYFGPFFILGAWASQFQVRLRWLENPVTEWLGRISYPLYLSHFVVLEDAHLPLWAAIPAAIGVAQLLTWTVERWSISASRQVGRLRVLRAPLHRGSGAPALAAGQ